MASYDFAFKLNPGLEPLLDSWEIACLWADKDDDKIKHELKDCIDKWITSGELKSTKTVYRPAFWPKHAPNRFRVEVHRDDFKDWLIKRGAWPLPPQSKLSMWWPDSESQDISFRWDRLYDAMKDAMEIILNDVRDRQINVDDMFDYLCRKDKSGVIVDSKSDQLIWETSEGKHTTATKKSLYRRLNNLKSYMHIT